jgi:drug/metabolite transporter (DMT)-like permease
VTSLVRNPAEHRKGVLLMVGATLCWASAGILVRNMTVKDSWEITFWRSLFMMVFIGVYLLRKRTRPGSALNLRISRASLVSGLLWASMYVCFLVALGRTSVANTLVVCSMAPFFAALAGRLLLHEAVPLRTWIAMAVAFGGIAAMFAGSMGKGAWLGNLIAALVPMAFAVNVVMLRRMHASTDPTITLVLSGIFSTLVTLPIALPFEVDAKDLVLLAIMGAVQLGLGCLLMVHATPRLAAAEVGLLSILETLFGTLSTWAIVGERPALATLIGGSVVLGALAVNEWIAMRRHTLTDSEVEALQSTSGH